MLEGCWYIHHGKQIGYSQYFLELLFLSCFLDISSVVWGYGDSEAIL